MHVALAGVPPRTEDTLHFVVGLKKGTEARGVKGIMESEEAQEESTGHRRGRKGRRGRPFGLPGERTDEK